jgi:hypothetical protein
MPSPNPEEVLKLAADMVAVKNTLASLQERWDALFANKSTPQKGGRKANPDGNQLRVLAVIEDNPDVPFDAALLQKELKMERRPIERALNNLFVAKKIIRHSRGHYIAKGKDGEFV